MANSEACELYIQQEIADGLAEGKKPGKIGKEVSAWVKKVFEVHIPARTLEKRARRSATKKSGTVVPIPTPTPEVPSSQAVTPPPPAEVVMPQTSEPEAEAVPPAPQPVKGGSKFNRTNDSVEWAWWSWNPVTGCKHGCEYCYARGMALRYPGNNPKGFEPHFRPERLSAPQNTPVPAESVHKASRQVFTVSMGDLFGAWVPQEWIDAVFKAIREAPQWNFILLTKNPARFLDLDFPKNCWIGATADTQTRADKALAVFVALREKFRVAKKKQPVLFLSVEPMREPIDVHLDGVDWLIIGGQSQTGGNPLQPEWGWFESLVSRGREAGCKI